MDPVLSIVRGSKIDYHEFHSEFRHQLFSTNLPPDSLQWWFVVIYGILILCLLEKRVISYMAVVSSLKSTENRAQERTGLGQNMV